MYVDGMKVHQLKLDDVYTRVRAPSMATITMMADHAGSGCSICSCGHMNQASAHKVA